MNLSSYLQMPPAPPVTKTPNTASVQGTATGVGLDAGASLGLDFAKIMARQFERLPQLQRQAFAAPSPNTGDATPRAKPEAQDTRVADRQAQDALDDGREADQARADAQDVPHHASAKKPTGVARKASDPHTDASEAGVPQAVTTAATANPTPGAPEVKPRALHANPYLKDVALPSSDASAPTPLRTVELSPHMRIITDPRKAPSPESLTAFAKSMGLDEEAIQKLMGADHAAPAVPAPLASTAGSPELSAANNAAMAAAADKMAQPLSDAQVAKLSAQLPGFGLSQIEAGAQPTPASAHPALPTLGAALQGMTPADLASIQQIQITVAPAAVAGLHPAGNSATPSTASVLSLMGAGLNEHDIGALAASFDAGAAGGESSLDSQGSGGQSADAHGFAQSLPQHASRTAGTSTTAQASSDVRMSEVYDQLSDKMATEMAARMHKQLTDGEWKMKFGLRPANLGGVEIQLEMKDGKLNALIQADNPLTRDLLQNSSQRLRDALENFGIHAGQFHIGQDSRGTQQNPSRGSAKESQVGENSTSQVKNSTSASSPDAVSPKANASLLDLYA